MGDEHDPFEGLTLDEDFVKGGMPESVARVHPSQVRRPEPPPPPRPPRPIANRRIAPQRRIPLILGVSWVFLAIIAGFVACGILAWHTTVEAPGAGFQFSYAAVFGFVITGWLLSLTFHEFAHASVAYLGGDRSVSSKGYLTLDVRRYVHPVLSFLLPVLFVILGGVGFPGGAVWIDNASLRTKAWRSAVSLAGPFANLICALGCLLPFVFISSARQEYIPGTETFSPHLAFWSGLAFLGLLQLWGALLNLLPFPGLDGWHALEPYLPPHIVMGARRVGPIAFLIIFFVVFSSPTIGGHLRSFLESIEGRFQVPSGTADNGYYFFRFWDS